MDGLRERERERERWMIELDWTGHHRRHDEDRTYVCLSVCLFGWLTVGSAKIWTNQSIHPSIHLSSVLIVQQQQQQHLSSLTHALVTSLAKSKYTYNLKRFQKKWIFPLSCSTVLVLRTVHAYLYILLQFKGWMYVWEIEAGFLAFKMVQVRREIIYQKNTSFRMFIFLLVVHRWITMSRSIVLGENSTNYDVHA